MTEVDQVSLNGVAAFGVVLVVSLLTIHYFPEKYSVIVPMFMAYWMYIVIEMCVSYKEYYIHEIALTCLNLDYVFIIFVPTRWKANSLVKL